MKTSVLVLFLTISVGALAQTKLYVHPDADNYVANTTTIAVLPLKTEN